MNLPNTITSARLILTAVFVASASWGGTIGLTIGLIAFVLASFSDWLDGYLARKLGLVTSLGKLLDPLADKILVASAFIFFTATPSAQSGSPASSLPVSCHRLRQIAVAKGVVIAADKLGKWKTTLQLVFGITCLLFLILDSTAPNTALADRLQSFCAPDSFLFLTSLYGALALTVLSGANYLKKSRKLFAD